MDPIKSALRIPLPFQVHPQITDMTGIFWVRNTGRVHLVEEGPQDQQ